MPLVKQFRGERGQKEKEKMANMKTLDVIVKSGYFI